jgi:hypothetical protein
MSPRPFNIWPWLPLIVIGAAAIANGVFVVVARRVSPQKVEDRPYAASAHFDADKAAGAAFTAKGYRLEVAAPSPASLRLGVSGGASGAAEVRLYRPDAPSADVAVPWPDVAQPLTIALSRQGFWRLDLRLVDAGGTPLAAAAAIDTLEGRAP